MFAGCASFFCFPMATSFFLFSLLSLFALHAFRTLCSETAFVVNLSNLKELRCLREFPSEFDSARPSNFSEGRSSSNWLSCSKGQMTSSETWSKILLLNSTILLVISSAYTLDIAQRLTAADDLPSTTSPFPSSRDELKPFVVQGILCVALSIVAIAASFIKRRCVIRIVFLAIIVVELCAVYTNRTAMHTGFLKCHEQYGPSIRRVIAVAIGRVFGSHVLFVVSGLTVVPGNVEAEGQCVDSVHSLFATATVVLVSVLSLVMCSACKTHEVVSDDDGSEVDEEERCGFIQPEETVEVLLRMMPVAPPAACYKIVQVQ